jgi:hypothetical protein
MIERDHPFLSIRVGTARSGVYRVRHLPTTPRICR